MSSMPNKSSRTFLILAGIVALVALAALENVFEPAQQQRQERDNPLQANSNPLRADSNPLQANSNPPLADPVSPPQANHKSRDPGEIDRDTGASDQTLARAFEEHRRNTEVQGIGK